MKGTELRELGFSDPEIKVYLSLLESGTISGSHLAKKTKMYRPYVYDTLEKLIGKGIVTYTHVGNKREFKCAPPSALHRIIEEERISLSEKEKTVNSLIPELEKLYLHASSPHTVEVFEGKAGFKSYYEFVLEIGLKGKIKELRSYGGGQHWFELLKNYYPNLLKRAVEGNISKKLHYMQLWDTSLKNSKNSKVIGKVIDIRYLKGVPKTAGGIITFNDYVALSNSQDNIRVILVKDPILANTMKSMYDLLWKKASK